jgi:hypothetical protein
LCKSFFFSLFVSVNHSPYEIPLSNQTLMSEDKYDKLLNTAIVLLIASASVLGYSVYNTHFSKSGVNPNLSAVNNNLRDSLKNIYTNTVTSIDTNLVRTNSESNPELEEKYREVDALKAEINKLLLSDGEGNISSAQQKITELQQKITVLEIRYQDASEQNRKLQEILNQLKANKANQTNNGKNENQANANNEQLEKQAKAILQKQSVNTKTTQMVNQATEMSFYATTNSNNQTTKIANADKLEGAFLFKYKTPYSSNDPIYIVVIQPDGKTIKGPSWDIGVFESDEGKKVFTKKIPLELNGEPQKVNFNILPDDFIAGPYTMEIWYKKNLIGTKVRTLL